LGAEVLQCEHAAVAERFSSPLDESLNLLKGISVIDKPSMRESKCGGRCCSGLGFVVGLLRKAKREGLEL
jgi:hypothetical protein